MGDATSNSAKLFARFVATLFQFNEMVIRDYAEELSPELDVGFDDSPNAFRVWKPAAIATPSEALDQLYRKIPQQFPVLYERLLLSYRWLEVRVADFVVLYPNPPAQDLEPLLENMTRDRALIEVLFSENLLPFGKATDGSFDPICFNVGRVDANSDCPIVRVEHESLLYRGRLGRMWPVSESFRCLVQTTIADSQSPQ